MLAGVLACACTACTQKQAEASYQVVPLPQEVNVTGGEPFRLDRSSIILYPEGNEKMQQNALFLAEYIGQSAGFVPQAKPLPAGQQPQEGSIVLQTGIQAENSEAYELTVDGAHVTIGGATEQGVFYGIQTLRKAIPVQTGATCIVLPAAHIADQPRFAYRGMHLDVCRHFFDVDFIKRYIDMLALHNINTFHWHLTDDQGWRIEIKKYPKLTEIGSKRSRTVIGRNSGQYDHTPYGGFYTQEQAREIVEYARKRYINVVPEVDLPGHMLAALAAYPHLGCTGGPYEVCPEWGIFEDVLCIGNDETLRFLKGVMEEIIEIFPSKYIHIGGDESPRSRWEKCPKCQALIRRLGLKDDARHSAEDRLQSYCMKELEAFLNGRGRQIIGWDEILEGEVAPNATVMSWRGMEGGIEAAKLGHDVIMVPTSFVYFDYYQTDRTQDEPLAIGGYVPVEKVYSLEPVPASLTPEEAKHILGAQANLWTEYIATPGHVEYMVLPRMAALSEVQWTMPAKKDYNRFATRLTNLMKLYRQLGYNFATHLYDIRPTYMPNTERKAVLVSLKTVDNAPVYYTLDGTEPNETSTPYTGTIEIAQSAQFRAAAIRADGPKSTVDKDIFCHKAAFADIRMEGQQPAPKYTYQGIGTLVDAMRGNDNYATGQWLGFIGGDMTAVVDLGKAQTVSRAAVNAIVDMGSWIMGCTRLTVWISDDGKTYTQVADQTFDADTDLTLKTVRRYETRFNATDARYLKVRVSPTPTLPKGHAGEGRAPYLFLDEIEID